MCSHTYTHFTLCDCVAVHTHQCFRCGDALYVMFCEDYQVIKQTVEGGCPNHRWRSSKDGKGGKKDDSTKDGERDAQTAGEQASGSGNTAQQ